jgi:cell division septation protein DedD
VEEAQNEPQDVPPAEPRPRASRTVRKANAGPQLRPLLTGIGVVVVLVAVIVTAGRYDRARNTTPSPPEVKPGRIQVEAVTPATPAADAGSPQAEGAAPPPVHFYEVLSGGREDAPVGAGQIALRPLPLPPPPGVEGKSAASGTAKKAAAPARPMKQAQAPAPATHAESRTESHAETQAKASAPAAAPAKAPAAPANGPKPYSLQVGSFSQRDGADKLADRLKDKGFDAYLVEVSLGDKGTWWRVRVGRFPTEYAAKWARLDLVKEGLSPIVVRDRAKP